MGTNLPAESAIALLADERNRKILTFLDEADEPLHASELAERIVTCEAALLSSSEYEREFERVVVSLHHNHLPRLDDEGLLDYDREENVATSRNVVAAEWIDVQEIDQLLARLRNAGAVEENAVGVIEGRNAVIERGRQLADGAKEELFLMYVTDDLLDDQCLVHARDAIDRGVDISLGSQNPNVRDLVRRTLPEATLWEPQLDWTNPPSRYPKVGRLILADREKLMLALLDEPDADGNHPETAVTGEGANNPLVVLVRELLGPRLDHLDYQSETFRGELPF